MQIDAEFAKMRASLDEDFAKLEALERRRDAIQEIRADLEKGCQQGTDCACYKAGFDEAMERVAEDAMGLDL